MSLDTCNDCFSDDDESLPKTAENKREKSPPVWKLKCGFSWVLWRFICMGAAYAMHASGEKWAVLFMIMALSAPACLCNVPRVTFEGLVLGTILAVIVNPGDTVL